MPRLHPQIDLADVPISLRRELIRFGLSDREIKKLVASGEIHRIRHGAYTDGQIWRASDDARRFAIRGRAVVKQAKSDVVLSHVSALAEWNAPLWGFDLGDVHLSRRDGRAGRAEAGVRQHCGALLPEDVVSQDGVELTSVIKTCLDVSMLRRPEPALVAVNHLLHEWGVDAARLRDRYERIADDAMGAMVRWPGSLQSNIVLHLADQRIESPGESCLLYLCWKYGLPLPIPQYEIRGADGRLLARVDFAWPELGIYLEFDGRVKYTTLLRAGQSAVDVLLDEKERDQAIFEEVGWIGIRVNWPQCNDGERTARRIKRVMASRAGLRRA